MSGNAYLGTDNRVRIQVDWSAGGGAQSREFLIDSGATRSGVDQAAAVGLVFRGAVAVQGVASTSQLLLFGGGTMTFDVEDTASGTSMGVTHVGDVLLINQCLMGTEVLYGQKLNLQMDYTSVPPSPHLCR